MAESKAETQNGNMKEETERNGEGERKEDSSKTQPYGEERVEVFKEERREVKESKEKIEGNMEERIDEGGREGTGGRERGKDS